jgi:hypothetical protein
MLNNNETPMIRAYWERVGGTLIEEFPATRKTPTSEIRRIDALILPNGPRKIVHWRDAKIEGEDVLVIQCKAHRLGMHLMGQTVFSLELIRAFKPNSVRAIALCKKTDTALEPLLANYPDVEVVVRPEAYE